MGEGNIQAARTRLGRAVQRLTAPLPGVYHDVTLWAPSLYQQLLNDLAGQSGDTRTPAKSLPPLWIDASQLLGEIDGRAKSWCPIPGDTPTRLQKLSFQGWRPQDTDLVSKMAWQVDSWCESILNLLDPEDRKFVEGASCPACSKSLVYRRDSAGEMVRQPALKIVVSQGCTCQACGAFWAPEKFLFLGRLLGYDVPEGVLE